MYHSEAVLLSDGRVMVSGSDPQDPDHPQEYRIEVYVPPYLVDGRIQPQIQALPITDWVHGQVYTITLQLSQTGPIRFSLLGAVASTHGSSMGIRTIFPEVTSIQPSYPHGVDSLCSSIALAIRARLQLHQTNTSAREFLITDVAIDKLTHADSIQARLVPTLCARWPNAQSREMGPNRWRPRQTWRVAPLRRLHEAWSLGAMPGLSSNTLAPFLFG